MIIGITGYLRCVLRAESVFGLIALTLLPDSKGQEIKHDPHLIRWPCLGELS